MIKCFLCLFLLPVSLYAQKENCYTIFINKKSVIVGDTKESSAMASISINLKGKLTIDYQCEIMNQDWSRSFIIMNNERQNLLTKNIEINKKKISIDISILKEKTKQLPFKIYTIALPNDKQLAASIRVKPILLGSIVWE